jgi:hypothetical protein
VSGCRSEKKVEEKVCVHICQWMKKKSSQEGNVGVDGNMQEAVEESGFLLSESRSHPCSP